MSLRKAFIKVEVVPFLGLVKRFASFRDGLFGLAGEVDAFFPGWSVLFIVVTMVCELQADSCEGKVEWVCVRSATGTQALRLCHWFRLFVTVLWMIKDIGT